MCINPNSRSMTKRDGTLTKRDHTPGFCRAKIWKFGLRNSMLVGKSQNALGKIEGGGPNGSNLAKYPEKQLSDVVVLVVLVVVQ